MNLNTVEKKLQEALKIGRQHGPTSWGAAVVLSPVVRAGKPSSSAFRILVQHPPCSRSVCGFWMRRG